MPVRGLVHPHLHPPSEAVPAMQEQPDIFDQIASQVIELGNASAEKDQEADLWDIADGLLAGAIHYWLYSRQPCGDPRCLDCAPVSTAEERIAEMVRVARQFAQDSDYFHSPTDSNAGHA